MSSSPSSEIEDRFRSAVSLQSLQQGTELVLDTENADFSSDDDDYFDEASYKSFKEELVKACCDDDDASSPDLSSFEVLREKMVSLTDDGHVRKLVLKPGCGPVIFPKSLVLIHYNAYLEKQPIPFDSTYQRNSPFRFLLKDGRVVLGLDIGIATMKKGEVASFLIEHDYAYGPMGCPPRVPENATVYYEVEVLNYIDSADAVEFEQMTLEERQRAPFDKIFSACKAENQMGKNLFDKKMYAGATSRYRKATRMLEDISVANEQEDKERQSLLLRLYMNLSVCYMKLKNSKKCRINALNVLKQDPRSVKALYMLAKSYYFDAEYDEALKHLHRARKYDPYNKEICKEISNVEKVKKQHTEKERLFCKNIFGCSQNNDSQFNEPKEFVDSITVCVKQFKESSEKEYSFSPGLTLSQIEDIKTIASLNGVHFIEKVHDGNKICKLCK